MAQFACIATLYAAANIKLMALLTAPRANYGEDCAHQMGQALLRVAPFRTPLPPLCGPNIAEETIFGFCTPYWQKG